VSPCCCLINENKPNIQLTFSSLELKLLDRLLISNLNYQSLTNWSRKIITFIPPIGQTGIHQMLKAIIQKLQSEVLSVVQA